MRHIVRRLTELGIRAETPLDLAVAMRACNVIAICMIVVSIIAVGSYLVAVGSSGLAFTSLAVALVYGLSLLLSAVGFFDAARALFLTAASVNYGEINLAFGQHSGAGFWIVALVSYPVVAYTRRERRRVAAVYVALGVVFVATHMVSRAWGPLIHEARALQQAHYFQLFFLSAVVGFSLHYYKNSTVTARAALDAAHVRIAELLDNMLPPSIVVRLQRGERVIADIHGEASVLFADLTSFSALTQRLSPPHLVEVLNQIFSRFDEAATRHGIEKIKTIGDCYMAATGVLDDERSGSEMDAMAEFALEIVVIVDAMARELGLPLGVRVGVSSGAVVSGVIGTRRYNFDVWGDTVNLASQMERTAPVGRIQVSEATYWRLQRHYRFEPRGEIEVKSGRRVPTYLLLGRATDADVLAAGSA